MTYSQVWPISYAWGRQESHTGENPSPIYNSHYSCVETDRSTVEIARKKTVWSLVTRLMKIHLCGSLVYHAIEVLVLAKIFNRDVPDFHHLCFDIMKRTTNMNLLLGRRIMENSACCLQLLLQVFERGFPQKISHFD